MAKNLIAGLMCLFCINMLTADQQEIAAICSDSKKSDERAKHFEFVDEDTPVLSNAFLNIICRVDQIFEYHSHSLVVGTVQDVKSLENQESLIYQNGSYKVLPKAYWPNLNSLMDWYIHPVRVWQNQAVFKYSTGQVTRSAGQEIR